MGNNTSHNRSSLSEKDSEYYFTAPVEMPSREQMRVKLVPLHLVNRLEEARSDERFWGAVFWTVLGAILGIICNWVTSDPIIISRASLVVMAILIVVGVLSCWGGVSKYKARAESIKLEVTQAGVNLPDSEFETLRRQNGRESRIVFRDTFDDFTGWEDFRSGNVSQSRDRAHAGTYSLKKDGANDPNGGFKEIGKRIGLGFVFSGWIFSPSERGGGKADRLAIEDGQFDGYGFAVDRDKKTVYIERRDRGKQTCLGSEVPLDDLLMDQWYQFKFFSEIGGTLSLRLYDLSGEEILNVPSVVHERYSSFDRVVVHGGFPYYVDDLEIQAI